MKLGWELVSDVDVGWCGDVGLQYSNLDQVEYFSGQAVDLLDEVGGHFGIVGVYDKVFVLKKAAGEQRGKIGGV